MKRWIPRRQVLPTSTGCLRSQAASPSAAGRAANSPRAAIERAMTSDISVSSVTLPAGSPSHPPRFRNPPAGRGRPPPQPHGELASDDEPLALALEDARGEEPAQIEDARERDARLPHRRAELPRALALVRERG